VIHRDVSLCFDIRVVAKYNRYNFMVTLLGSPPDKVPLVHPVVATDTLYYA
jgi:hypothetical protein